MLLSFVPSDFAGTTPATVTQPALLRDPYSTCLRYLHRMPWFTSAPDDVDASSVALISVAVTLVKVSP